jgi:GWxTD domain-containing protein
MMRLTISLLLIAGSFTLQAQALSSINYSYLYSPSTEINFQYRLARQGNGLILLYQLETNDINKPAPSYDIRVETRQSLGDKEGTLVPAAIKTWLTSNNLITGSVPVPATDPWIVVRIENAEKKKAWYFPVAVAGTEQFYAQTPDTPVVPPYLNEGTAIQIPQDTLRPLVVSYYGQDFPAAAPAFSTAQARVNKVMKADSVFSFSDGTSFSKKGLYLIQRDTAATTGLSLRVESDYPKLGTLESLAGPLVYICTKQEYDRIRSANGDKKKFDQVILNITGNSERARTFMRNYFRRVELANKYFSSYKEGWKTDRGMMYIIFGEPDEVYKTADRETWEYKGSTTNMRFQFVRSATVFDPDNFVLIREKRFTDTWYQVIDLWRKARF